jgi:parallel beta-helix repeat protein
MKATLTFLVPTGLFLFSASCHGAVFTVTTTNDSGGGSLRQAISAANTTPGSHQIRFAIPGEGVQTIAPLSELPGVSNRISIDGYSQPGTRTNSLASGNDAVLLIRLDGFLATNTPSAALRLQGVSGCSIRGLIIVRFWAGIELHSSSGNTIAGNWIGLDADNLARGNLFDGVSITCPVFSRAAFNVVGGVTPADRNVISGNNAGITISPAQADRNVIQGNFIGTDATGTLPRGNTFDGIHVMATTNVSIGGSVAGARNLISANGSGITLLGGAQHIVQGNYFGTDVSGRYALGNKGTGILLQGSDDCKIGGVNAGNLICNSGDDGLVLLGSARTLVQGNFIGTDSTSVWQQGNGGAGIYIQGGSSSKIGGASAGEGNVIRFNSGSGVGILAGATNTISGNSIYNNEGLGIDLQEDKVTSNDPGDVDFGPNDLQNYPVIASASSGQDFTTIQGSLNSQAGGTYHIEFFASPAWDSLGIPEGQIYLGSTSVTTDGAGDATFSVVLPVAAPKNFIITATATDQVGNTSEFSTNGPQVVGPQTVSLSILRGFGDVTISWPSSSTGYVLEGATSLAAPIQWVPITSGILDDSLTKTYTETVGPAPGQKYFRLKK